MFNTKLFPYSFLGKAESILDGKSTLLTSQPPPSVVMSQWTCLLGPPVTLIVLSPSEIVDLAAQSHGNSAMRYQDVFRFDISYFFFH